MSDRRTQNPLLAAIDPMASMLDNITGQAAPGAGGASIASANATPTQGAARPQQQMMPLPQPPAISPSQQMVPQGQPGQPRQGQPGPGQPPQPPPSPPAQGIAPPSIVEGMATAVGRNDLAQMMSFGRAEAARLDNENYQRQQDAHKNLTEMYKLELMMQSPVERDLNAYNKITDPKMKRMVGIKLGLVQPKPALMADYGSIASFSAWMQNNPEDVTPVDIQSLNNAWQEYQQNGFELDHKEGGTIIETAGPGLNFSNRPPLEGRQYPGEGQQQQWGKETPVMNGQINDRAMMTQRVRSPVYSEIIGNKRITRNTDRDPLTGDKEWLEWKDAEGAAIRMRNDLVRVAELMAIAPDDPTSSAGTEFWSKQGAKMQTIWGNIMSDWRRATVAGTLDQGAITLFTQMLGNPADSDWKDIFSNVNGQRAQNILGNIEELVRSAENHRGFLAKRFLSEADQNNWKTWNMKKGYEITQDDVEKYMGNTIDMARLRAITKKTQGEIDELKEKDSKKKASQTDGNRNAPSTPKATGPAAAAVPASKAISNALPTAPVDADTPNIDVNDLIPSLPSMPDLGPSGIPAFEFSGQGVDEGVDPEEMKRRRQIQRSGFVPDANQFSENESVFNMGS